MGIDFALFKLQRNHHSLEMFDCVLADLLQRPKTPESQKYAKIVRKIQNRPPRVGPRKYEKIMKEYKFGQFWAILVNFSYFRGPARGGRFRIFSRNFSYFWDSEARNFLIARKSHILGP